MRRMLFIVSLVATAGCERAMVDSRVAPLEPTPFFADGRASRPEVPGTIRRNAPAAISADATPDRGAEQFATFCAPCHGADGRGDGPLVGHGFPRPPSLLSGHGAHHGEEYIVDVITNGIGIMPPYAELIAPADRQAIARWLKTVQEQQ